MISVSRDHRYHQNTGEAVFIATMLPRSRLSDVIHMASSYWWLISLFNH